MKAKILASLCLLTIAALLDLSASAQVHAAGSSVPTLADWEDARFDAAHTGFNPLEQILTTANVGTLVPYMTYYLRGTTAYSFSNPPVLVNGVLYAEATDSVNAIDVTTGALLWKFKAALSGYPITSPTVVNGIVYVGGLETLYALNAATGAVLWTFPQATSYPPTVANGLVYVAVRDTLYALNAVTGNGVWLEVWGPGQNIANAATVSGGLVYFPVYGSQDHDVVALNAITGQTAWHQSNQSWVLGSEIASGSGNVFFTERNQMHALDATTGNVVWSYSMDDSAYSPPSVANGVVYVVSASNTVYALDAGTGNLLWNHAASGPTYGTLVVANGVIYVGTNENAYALNASTGDLLWEHDATYTFGSYPLVVNGVLYVAASHGNIDSFHLPQ